MTKIKPLVWEGKPDELQTANSVVGKFLVFNGQWLLSRSLVEHCMMQCRDDETAKAAAQAHYESLIRSTLE